MRQIDRYIEIDPRIQAERKKLKKHNEFENPVIRQDAADAHVMYHTRYKMFIAYFTQCPNPEYIIADEEAEDPKNSRKPAKWLNVPCRTSIDGINWTAPFDALPNKNRITEGTQDFWAPAVISIMVCIT